MNHPAVNTWPVLLRIAVGCSWLVAGASKVVDPAYASSLLAPTLIRWSNLNHGPIASFIATSLVPNVGVLAFIVKVAELLIGVALVLGFLTRLAAFAGLLAIGAAWVLQEGFATLGGYGVGTFLVMITMLYLTLASSGHFLALDAIRSGRSRTTSTLPLVQAAPIQPEEPSQAPITMQ
jgi:thiosulfate dehydrogenase [quinone] large subunit